MIDSIASFQNQICKHNRSTEHKQCRSTVYFSNFPACTVAVHVFSEGSDLYSLDLRYSLSAPTYQVTQAQSVFT